MLKFHNVRKYFNGRMILDILSLELDSNLYWVQGENGSGKSTFLRMVAGLIPFEGQIFFKEIDSSLHPVSYRQNISWADAEPLYPAFMTGQSLLDFYRNIRGATTREAKTLTETIGIKEFIHEKTGTYSSGTLKKLSLLLAFIGSPSLILLDEPLITLDNTSMAVVCDLVREKQLSGSLILVSSHLELDALAAFSDKRLAITNHTVKLL
jgi:ABC-2 type transport system ATP-binding protein